MTTPSKNPLSAIEIPGWIWPIIILVLQQVIDHYSTLDTPAAITVVVVLMALVKLIQVFFMGREREEVIEEVYREAEQPVEGARRGGEVVPGQRVRERVVTRERPRSAGYKLVEWIAG